MTDKILTLVPPNKPGNAEAISILEELLIQAKAGNVVGFAYAVVLPDGSSQTQCTFTDNFQQLLGAMRILEFRMIDEARTVMK